MELPHRAPARLLWLASPLRLVRKALHFRCFYKSGRSWSAGRSDTALALEQNQPEFPTRKPAWKASSATSTDRQLAPLPPPVTQPGFFPLTSRPARHNTKKRPRSPASCLLPNLATKCSDRERGAGGLALMAERTEDGKHGVPELRKGTTEFGVESAQALAETPPWVLSTACVCGRLTLLAPRRCCWCPCSLVHVSDGWGGSRVRRIAVVFKRLLPLLAFGRSGLACGYEWEVRSHEQ